MKIVHEILLIVSLLVFIRPNLLVVLQASIGTKNTVIQRTMTILNYQTHRLELCGPPHYQLWHVVDLSNVQ